MRTILYFDESPARTPMVFLPGALVGAEIWEPVARRMSIDRPAVRAQLLTVQLALQNEPLPADYSIQTELNAFTAALDGAGLLAPIDLVGWSVGGLVAMEFALAHPHRVRSLTLFEPAALWVLDPAMAEIRAFRERANGWTDAVPVDDLEWFVRGTGNPDVSGDEPTKHERWPVWVKHRNALRVFSKAVFDFRPSLERLRALTTPTRLVLGRGSRGDALLVRINHAVAKTLMERLPNATMVDVPGGHAAPFAEPDAFVAQLRPFVAGVIRAP